jgi:hypothetical protein
VSTRGSVEQLAINLGTVILAGTTVLALQRLLYRRRRERHRHEQPLARARETALRPTSRASTRSRSSS